MNHGTLKYVAVGASALVAMFVLCLAIKAWTEPGSGVTPPGGSVVAPLNTGDADQTKTGKLNIGTGWQYWITKINNGFALVNNSGQTNFFLTQDGKVGIGTTSPLGNVDIENGANSAQICLNGKCCTTWDNCRTPVADCASSWADGSCNAGPCTANPAQRQQFKASTPAGCNTASRCVADNKCTAICSPGTQYGCGKCNAKGTAWESTCTGQTNGANDVCSAWGPSVCSQVHSSLATADCNSITGWVCNSGTPRDPLWVEFYVDATTHDGYLGWSDVANLAGGAATQVAGMCGGTSNHWFNFKVPSATVYGGWPIHDGLPHKIYMAAKQSSNGSGWYMMPTVTLTCPQQ